MSSSPRDSWSSPRERVRSIRDGASPLERSRASRRRRRRRPRDAPGRSDPQVVGRVPATTARPRSEWPTTRALGSGAEGVAPVRASDVDRCSRIADIRQSHAGRSPVPPPRARADLTITSCQLAGDRRTRSSPRKLPGYSPTVPGAEPATASVGAPELIRCVLARSWLPGCPPLPGALAPESTRRRSGRGASGSA